MRTVLRFFIIADLDPNQERPLAIPCGTLYPIELQGDGTKRDFGRDRTR
jgi:hypothetical protein